MDASVALHRRSFSFRSMAALLALLLAFATGGISGYAVRAMTTGAYVQAQPSPACPLGTHVEVWYSAGSWGCVRDQVP
jgi:hypothetical protein